MIDEPEHVLSGFMLDQALARARREGYEQGRQTSDLPRLKSLGEMTAEVDTLVHDKGWRDRPVSFGEAMATLHSEVSEALEAWRVWGLEDKTGPDIVSNDRTGELRWPSKPEGVGSEFADVLIRLLDDCALFGVDLEAEYERKMTYNRSRTYRHGGKRL